VGEPDGFDEFVGAGRGRGVEPAADVQGQQELLPDGEGGQQVRLLEDEADVAAAGGGALLVREGGQLGAGDPDGARGGPLEAAGDGEQTGLAGSGGADDGDELAGGRRSGRRGRGR
jgi:hypothetical protein